VIFHIYQIRILLPFPAIAAPCTSSPSPQEFPENKAVELSELGFTTDLRLHRLELATFLNWVQSVVIVFSSLLSEGGDTRPPLSISKSSIEVTKCTSSNILVWFGRDAPEESVAGLRESLFLVLLKNLQKD